MKRNIICDTMIWYYLGNGLLDYSEFKDDNLIATRVNIYELANTPNLFIDFQYYKNALKGLKVYSNKIIKDAPIQYLANCGKEKHTHDYGELTKILNSFDKIIALPNNFELKNTDYIEYKENIEANKIEKNKETNNWNQLLPIVRENIKKISNKKKHREIDSICYIKMLIKKIVREKYFINWNNYDWNLIMYFVKVWDMYFKELELCQTRKIEDNDWLDIFNFSYVMPDFYYLTCETKWKNIIKNDTEMYNRLIFKEITPHNKGCS